MSPGEAARVISITVQQEVEKIKQNIVSRYPQAANKLRNAELQVLRGPSPSAPGSPPGVRTGNLRRNWTMEFGGSAESGYFGITSGMYYAGYLEDGTYKMAARPFVDPIQQKALPEIRALFQEVGG